MVLEIYNVPKVSLKNLTIAILFSKEMRLSWHMAEPACVKESTE